MSTTELENNFILVRTWHGVIEIYDKIQYQRFSYYNHCDDKVSCLIHMVLDRFTQETTAERIKADIQEINNEHYHAQLNYEEHEVKKIPWRQINSSEELQGRFKNIKDKPLKIRIKNLDSWNTVNQRNIPLILKHSTVKCDGHYTDDYAFDATDDFGRGAASDGCKISILNDLMSSEQSYIKCYWCPRDKEFTIYYGQWLSYSAKPQDTLKLVFLEANI